jgi:antirestriction protein ArdC
MLLRAGRIVKEDDTTGDKQVIPFVRGFRVFNIGETTGLDLPPLEACEVKHTSDTHEACDTIIKSMPKRPDIVHAPGRAFYRPSTDTVSLPDRDQFKVQEQYDMVRFHEVIHATGHEQRLARPGITDANLFGDHSYSREELVAEIGAATLGRTVGLDRSKIDKASAAYLQSWLGKIADKPEAIITAANHAQAAADFVLGVTDRYENTKA